MKLNILKIGVTVQKDGEILLVVDGEMPPDCVVVFMDKESWKKLKQEMPDGTS